MSPNNLQSIASITKKYSYEKYDSKYTSLFENESKKIKDHLAGIRFNIYHIGSTSIPGVGGKGVIDMYISASPKNLDTVSKKLIHSGYEFRESGGDKYKRFFQKEYRGRRYHIHLTFYNNKGLIEAIAFRDFLRDNPLLAKEYSMIKKKASKLALQMKTKEEIKKVYAEVKQPVIDKILNAMGLIKI